MYDTLELSCDDRGVATLTLNRPDKHNAMSGQMLQELQAAARALAAGMPQASVLTYLAAFTCADNFREIAAEAIQLHGGIAYTMEHPAHLYWRRARTGQWLFGSSDRFRDLYLSGMEAAL